MVIRTWELLKAVKNTRVGCFGLFRPRLAKTELRNHHGITSKLGFSCSVVISEEASGSNHLQGSLIILINN